MDIVLVGRSDGLGSLSHKSVRMILTIQMLVPLDFKK